MQRSSRSRSPSTEAVRALGIAAGLWLVPWAAHAQSVSNTASLSFGSFTAGSGGGTVQLNAGGGRAATGTVMLFNQGGSAAAAQFMLSGSSGESVTITLPSDGTVLLSDGSNTMAVNSFTSSPSGGSGTLSGGGTLTLLVGATLTVAPNQPAGSYSGSFNVTINFN